MKGVLMMNKIVCLFLLCLLPVIANAEMCATIDDNLNVVEYECGTNPVATQKLDSDYAMYVRAGGAIALDSGALVGLGLRAFDKEKMSLDVEISGVYASSHKVDSYSLFLNARLGYNLKNDVMLYGGVGVGCSHSDEYDIYYGTSVYFDGYVYHEYDYTYTGEAQAISAMLTLGAEYDVLKRFSIFAEYFYMPQFVESSGVENMHILSLGVKYSF